MIFLDIETTGVNSRVDEILEIAALDITGAIRFHSYLRPLGVSLWPKAQEQHGLSPEFIFSPENNFPTLQAVAPQLDHVLDGEVVVTYNNQFDLVFLSVALHNIGYSHQPWRRGKCCMVRYAEFVKAPKSKPYYQGNYKNFKLIEAAAAAGYNWKGMPHGAIADADACRHVWLWLNEQRGREILSETVG